MHTENSYHFADVGALVPKESLMQFSIQKMTPYCVGPEPSYSPPDRRRTTLKGPPSVGNRHWGMGLGIVVLEEGKLLGT